MSIFLTVSGFIIGVSVFLYFVSFFDEGKRKLAPKMEGNVPSSIPSPKRRDRINAENEKKSIQIAATDILDGMPTRTCPLCGKVLSRKEPLYATHMIVGQQKKIFIHGCPYCYKD